jgi:hypothetical protein
MLHVINLDSREIVSLLVPPLEILGSKVTDLEVITEP